MYVFVDLCGAVGREKSLKSPHASVTSFVCVKLSVHTHLNNYKDCHKVAMCAFVKLFSNYGRMGLYGIIGIKLLRFVCGLNFCLLLYEVRHFYFGEVM